MDKYAALEKIANEMAEELEHAKEIFLIYEMLHREKCTNDGDKKAEANKAHAESMDTALKLYKKWKKEHNDPSE